MKMYVIVAIVVAVIVSQVVGILYRKRRKNDDEK